MKKSLIKIVIMLCFVFQFFPNYSCVAEGFKKNNPANALKLHIFNVSDIHEILKKAGLNANGISLLTHNDIIRNLEGTEVKIFLRNLNKCVILKNDGEIITIDIPGSRSWINKKNEVVAWVEKNTLHFKNGDVTKMIGLCPSDYDGEFLIKSTINGLKLVSFNRPDYYLADIDLLGSGGLKLFKKNNSLFIFGYSTNNNEEHLLEIYEKGSIGYLNKEHHVIPKPLKTSSHYYVEDIQQSDDCIIIRDTYDLPYSSYWYKFDLKNRKMELIGRASFRALFLAEDEGWGQICSKILSPH